jgi:crossover junction endodeoxyribonuclease RusA
MVMHRSPRRGIGARAPEALTPDQFRVAAELAECPSHAITFTVHGPAATKGSNKFVPHPKKNTLVAVPDAKRLPIWTQAVAWSAKSAGVKKVEMPGGVVMRLWLIFARPKSVSVTARPLMVIKPDVDKVLRAALDALTGIAYHDDAQVVDAHPIKRYGPRSETIVQIWEERSAPAVPVPLWPIEGIRRRSSGGRV